MFEIKSKKGTSFIIFRQNATFKIQSNKTKKMTIYRQIPSVEPTRIQCQYCNEVVMTEVRKVKSASTFAASTVVGGGACFGAVVSSLVLPCLLLFTSCCLPCCCCVPCCMKDLKTTIHTCPRCRKIVGTCEGAQEFL